MTSSRTIIHILASLVFLIQIVFYYLQAYRFGLGTWIFVAYSLLSLIIYFSIVGYHWLKGVKRKLSVDYISTLLALVFVIQLAFWIGRWTLE